MFVYKLIIFLKLCSMKKILVIFNFSAKFNANLFNNKAY